MMSTKTRVPKPLCEICHLAGILTAANIWRHHLNFKTYWNLKLFLYEFFLLIKTILDMLQPCCSYILN